MHISAISTNLICYYIRVLSSSCCSVCVWTKINILLHDKPVWILAVISWVYQRKKSCFLEPLFIITGWWKYYSSEYKIHSKDRKPVTLTFSSAGVGLNVLNLCLYCGTFSLHHEQFLFMQKLSSPVILSPRRITGVTDNNNVFVHSFLITPVLFELMSNSSVTSLLFSSLVFNRQFPFVPHCHHLIKTCD